MRSCRFFYPKRNGYNDILKIRCIDEKSLRIINIRCRDRVRGQFTILIHNEVKLHKEKIFVISQKQRGNRSVSFSFWNIDRIIPRIIWHNTYYFNPESRPSVHRKRIYWTRWYYERWSVYSSNGLVVKAPDGTGFPIQGSRA